MGRDYRQHQYTDRTRHSKSSLNTMIRPRRAEAETSALLKTLLPCHKRMQELNQGTEPRQFEGEVEGSFQEVERDRRRMALEKTEQDMATIQDNSSCDNHYDGTITQILEQAGRHVYGLAENRASGKDVAFEDLITELRHICKTQSSGRRTNAPRRNGRDLPRPAILNYDIMKPHTESQSLSSGLCRSCHQKRRRKP